MSNKTHNNIISLLSFIVTIGFVVLKILKLTDSSWWMIVVPWVLSIFFREPNDDDDDNDDYSNNNLKMA